MGRRPDYVPPTWSDNRFNRWIAARPTRVIGFYAVVALVALGVVVWAIVDPKDYFHNPKAIGALIAVPLIVYQAIRYGRRAVQAKERSEA